jgi:glycosyltransferase involved in cell wall biosynthesis
MAARYPRKIVGSAPNSTDGSAIAAQRLRCEQEGRAAVRASLGLGAQFYLAGLGRLVAEKDFMRLLRVAAALRSTGVDVGVILIGSGPEEGALRDQARALGMHNSGDVVFTGGISDQKLLARWLYAADACVSPGPLGLSTVDCLFAGVPVISYEPSSRGVHHGPEWRYLTPGKTGWFADAYSDDALALVCREYLGRSDESRASVRAACADYARDHLGIDRMVDGMMAVVTAALPKARGAEASR